MVLLRNFVLVLKGQRDNMRLRNHYSFGLLAKEPLSSVPG
jgi:hypothetical protein